MPEYRITKYDPAHRDAAGAYTRTTWTTFGDVGRSFEGVVLTPAAYAAVEDAYVDTAVAFLRESAVGALNVSALQNARAVSLPLVAPQGQPEHSLAGTAVETAVPCHGSVRLLVRDSLGDESSLKVDEIAPALRRLLREQFWCRLEGAAAFVHVGWDYYMYVGVPHPCPSATAAAGRRGLFVEPFLSPYVPGRRPG